MMAHVNKYWLAAALVWLMAMGLTAWNLSTIETVAQARDQNERLRREINFHHHYSAKLAAVRQSAEALFLPVDSVKLGFIAVQSHLEALAAVFGLEQVKVSRQVGPDTAEQLPIRVAFVGSFEGAMQFIFALREFPYLPVDRTQINVDRERGTIVEINLIFKYRLRPAEDLPPEPLRTTRYPASNEVSPS
jgi:hypothetical protein